MPILFCRFQFYSFGLNENSSKGFGPALRRLTILILGIIMYLIGWRKDYLFISTLSLIPALFGLTAYLYGPRISRALRFPILYLLLLAPPPLGILDAVTLPMRYGVSLAAYIILRSFHFSIIREGLMLSIEGLQIFMGPACSGFRSLITKLTKVSKMGLIYVLRGFLWVYFGCI